MATEKILMSSSALSLGQKLTLWLVSLGKVGFCPYAPGTAGSLASVLLLAVLFHGFKNHLAAWAGHASFWIICLGLTLLGFYGGQKAINKMLATFGQQDFGWIVFDEALGIWVTALGALAVVVACRGSAAFAGLGEVKFWILVFVSFRIFDILKVFPGSWFDKNWINGAGIMLDDLVAAVYAGGLSGLVLLFWP